MDKIRNPAYLNGSPPLDMNLGVSTLSPPFLGDHRLHDTAVLPGSFLIEFARSTYSQVKGDSTLRLTNMSFGSPVILSEEVFEISVRTETSGAGRIRYTFTASPTSALASEGDRRPFTTLEIESRNLSKSSCRTNKQSFSEFKQGAAEVTAGKFYACLWSNGNRYGPALRNVSDIWKKTDQAIGKVRIRRDLQPDVSSLRTVLLDSAIQLLAVLAPDHCTTFILKSIEEIELSNIGLPDTLWVEASTVSGPETEETTLTGDVHVFDDNGTTFLHLHSVALAFLEPLESGASKTANKTDICLASTFTADLLEDSLTFWGHHFEMSLNIQFAPYNQVFQQLLDRKSLFHQNRDGVNVVVLNLADWGLDTRRTQMQPAYKYTPKALEHRSTCVLPNGLTIAHLNRYETDYLYREIFEDESYLENGIELNDGDTVLDVGANIGMFALFVKSICDNPTIYAFEPSPVVFDLMKANCDAHGGDIRAFNIGISDRTGTGNFTFYEHSSVFSGFYADEHDDRQAIETIVRNTLIHEISAESHIIDEYVDELTTDRLKAEHYECPMKSLSDVIRENNIEKIHLLKIDAEKSELAILNGIQDGHWRLIEQIVIEIHDRSERTRQLVEGILGEKGYRCTVVKQNLLKNTGLFNIYATRREPGGDNRATCSAERLRKQTNDFCAAVKFLRDGSTVPLIVCVTPSRPHGLSGLIRNAEQQLERALAGIPDVHFINSGTILRQYPVAAFHDSLSESEGHIPYTEEGYAAIGTALFRTIFSLNIQPFKVIVLDCDNTLWKGACAEEGAHGIAITDAFRFVQEFMVEQYKRGMLICLCSKNIEHDVLDVFERRHDMILRSEHLTAWRINWGAKPDNLKSLADQLGLGLDSFIFVDDDALECAEVRITHPEILVLQLPRDNEHIPAFLQNIWIFDSSRETTREDTHRLNWYHTNAERVELRSRSFSLMDFIEGLQLTVEVAEAKQEELGRVSQLSFRTNQFNFTSRRRSESEIRHFLSAPNRLCFVVKVTDRFGEYGLVGAILYEIREDCYEIDSFLLSCRALGKGVEHSVLSAIARAAERDRKSSIHLSLIRTERNQPAFDFIAGIAERHKVLRGAQFFFEIPTAELTSLQYAPTQLASAMQVRVDGVPHEPGKHGSADLSMSLQTVGDELREIRNISAAVAAYRRQRPALPARDTVAPGTPVEVALTAIWKKVLKRAQVGINENFFDIGGTSLRAVQIVVMIRRELRETLSITDVFEYPTIARMARKLAAPIVSETPAEIRNAKSRGLRRKIMAKREKA